MLTPSKRIDTYYYRNIKNIILFDTFEDCIYLGVSFNLLLYFFTFSTNFISLTFYFMSVFRINQGEAIQSFSID